MWLCSLRPCRLTNICVPREVEILALWGSDTRAKSWCCGNYPPTTKASVYILFSRVLDSHWSTKVCNNATTPLPNQVSR